MWLRSPYAVEVTGTTTTSPPGPLLRMSTETTTAGSYEAGFVAYWLAQINVVDLLARSSQVVPLLALGKVRCQSSGSSRKC